MEAFQVALWSLFALARCYAPENLWKIPDGYFSLRISDSSAGCSDCMHLCQYVMLIPHQCSGMPWLRELHRLRWKHNLPQDQCWPQWPTWCCYRILMKHLCWNEEEGPHMAWHCGQKRMLSCVCLSCSWNSCGKLRRDAFLSESVSALPDPVIMCVYLSTWCLSPVNTGLLPQSQTVSLPPISAVPWAAGSCNFSTA